MLTFFQIGMILAEVRFGLYLFDEENLTNQQNTELLNGWYNKRLLDSKRLIQRFELYSPN